MFWSKCFKGMKAKPSIRRCGFRPLLAVWPGPVVALHRLHPSMWSKDTGLVRRGFLPALAVFWSIFCNHLLGSLSRRPEKSDLVMCLPFLFSSPSFATFSPPCADIWIIKAALCSCLHMKRGSLSSSDLALVTARHRALQDHPHNSPFRDWDANMKGRF